MKSKAHASVHISHAQRPPMVGTLGACAHIRNMSEFVRRIALGAPYGNDNASKDHVSVDDDSNSNFDIRNEHLIEGPNNLTDQERVDQVSKDTGFSEEKSKEIVRSAKIFTGGRSIEIRETQTNPDSSDQRYAKDASLLEDYIKRAPKFTGAIYTGVPTEQDVARNMRIGQEKDMKGISSWSSNKVVAGEFSRTRKTANGMTLYPVIYSTSGSKQATSIAHISENDEAEVLVSSKQKFIIKSISPINNNFNSGLNVELTPL